MRENTSTVANPGHLNVTSDWDKLFMRSFSEQFLSISLFQKDLCKFKISYFFFFFPVCHNDQPCIDFVEDTAQNFIHSTFESNFFEPVALLKAAVPTFKRQKNGRIICINTVAGSIGIPLHSIYCSAKFAFEGFLESIAAECMRHNVK